MGRERGGEGERREGERRGGRGGRYASLSVHLMLESGG